MMIHGGNVLDKVDCHLLFQITRKGLGDTPNHSMSTMSVFYRFSDLILMIVTVSSRLQPLVITKIKKKRKKMKMSNFMVNLLYDSSISPVNIS